MNKCYRVKNITSNTYNVLKASSMHIRAQAASGLKMTAKGSVLTGSKGACILLECLDSLFQHQTSYILTDKMHMYNK